MNTVRKKPQEYLSGNGIYIVLAAIASFPLFLAINSYVNSIHVHDDEAVSTAATGSFIAGIFLGRYLTQLWAPTVTNLSSKSLFRLAGLIVGCIVWLFFHAEFPFERYHTLNLLLFWLPFFVISVALGVLIKLVRAISQNQLKEAQALAAHSKSELHLLQSQLSPHFLFNTLNNLYGLSLTQHERIPPLLLKLSDLLRYSVYDANEIFVPLKDEIGYIKNYIEFEQIRIGDRLVLTTQFEETINTDCKIAPMLLIVFVENAFKHSKNTNDQRIFVTIEIKTWGNSILFLARNSHAKESEESTSVDKHSGFGLASVNKRLELLYPNEHELTIQNEEAVYQVALRLKMK